MTDRMLSEALVQNAIEVGDIPDPRNMPEPVPLQSTVPHRRVDQPLYRTDAASTERVTVSDSESTPQTFEEAFLAEQALGTEVDPDGETDDGSGEPSIPLTREQQLEARLAEMEQAIAEREAKEAGDKVVNDAKVFWSEKAAEGQAWETQLLAEIESYGREKGHSEAAIERAKNRAIQTEIRPWWNEYFLTREEGMEQARQASLGVDRVSLLIEEHGLAPEDRPKLLEFVKDPATMAAVAKLIGEERGKKTTLKTEATRQANRNVRDRMSREQFTPAVPQANNRQSVKVTGSDAELDFMVRNRPTIRQRR